jgi:hypothetical protein
MSEEEATEATEVTEAPVGGLGGGVQEQVTEQPAEDNTYQNFYDSLPDELKSNDTIKNTKDLTSLANQLVNAQSALGTKRLQAPQEDWGDEEWDGFFDQMRPEDDEYSIPELESDGSEPIELGDEQTQELVDFAAEMGLSQKQFDILYDRYTSLANEGQVQQTEEFQNNVQELRQQVQLDWGDNYNTNLALANQAYEAMSAEIPEIKELIESEPVVANHPAVLKLFHRLAEVSGDTLPMAENNPASGFANENTHGIKAQISEIDEGNATLIMSDPSGLNMRDRAKRQELLDKRANLYNKLYPTV